MPKSKRKAKKPSPKRRLLPKKAEKDQAFAELLVEFADVTNWRQRAFLAGFVLGKGLSGAHRLSGVHWKSHYRWLDNDPLYCETFQLAKRVLADLGEEEAYRRAFTGYETITQRGKIRSSTKSYSDALAIFLLKGMKPDVYGRYAPDPSSGGPSAIEITIKKEGEETEKMPELPQISLPCGEPEEE